MDLGTSGNYLKNDSQANPLEFVSRLRWIWTDIHPNHFHYSSKIVKAAEGVLYLHSINIYHGDIRGVFDSSLMQSLCLNIVQ